MYDLPFQPPTKAEQRLHKQVLELKKRVSELEIMVNFLEYALHGSDEIDEDEPYDDLGHCPGVPDGRVPC